MDTKALPSETADGGRVDLFGKSTDIAQFSPGDSTAASTRLLADAQALPALGAPELERTPGGVKPDQTDQTDKTDQSFLGKIAQNTWLQINGASYHFDRSKHFNEQNYGLGLMYRISPDKAVAVGVYENSIRQKSHYAYFDYEPLQFGPVRAGVLAGVVDGYYFNKGGPIPALLPTASIEGKNVGISAFYIPPMKQISSVIGFQARVKFW